MSGNPSLAPKNLTKAFSRIIFAAETKNDKR